MATAFRPPDLAPLRRQVREVTKVLGSPEPLLRAFGVATLGFIGQTFREGGRPAWTPLRPSTVAQRRAGRGSGSAKPLQNTGALLRSFDLAVYATRVVVFSQSKVGPWQHAGTRGPYPIRPKVAKALAWVGVGDGGGQVSFSGLGRGRPTGRGSFVGTPKRGGRTVIAKKAGASLVFAKGVMHPGLPARRILPTPEQITPVLVRTGDAFLRSLLARAR